LGNILKEGALGHRAILARENYKFNINFIEVLHIHVVLFRFFSYPESQNNSGILVTKKSDESHFQYLLLNFKSMSFGMFFNQMKQRKTHFLYMFS